jgi:hypothetical protein
MGCRAIQVIEIIEGISQLRNPPTHGVSELGNALEEATK